MCCSAHRHRRADYADLAPFRSRKQSSRTHFICIAGDRHAYRNRASGKYNDHPDVYPAHRRADHHRVRPDAGSEYGQCAGVQ